MFEYKTLVYAKQADMDANINKFAKSEGWRVHSLLPPCMASGPGRSWYACLEREIFVLTWPASTMGNLAGYHLYWSSSPQVWNLMTSVPKGTTSYRVPVNLYNSQGVEYGFAVAPYDTTGKVYARTTLAMANR